jgi:putative ABC transport system permease protein
VVINEEAAKRFFPEKDPIGRRLYFGRPRQNPNWLTIVGVVGNVLSESLETGPRPMVYRPLSQSSSLAMAVVARTTGDPAVVVASLGRAVRAVDPDLPAFAVRTMDQIVAAGTASRRFAIRLVGGFAALALVLAAIGIYGVMAYVVGQRTREIGIRVALGARRSEVVRMFVTRALALALGGMLVGGLASLVAGQLLEGQLFQIAPWDPWSFGTIAVLLVLTAAAASAAPAVRAARVDPIVALRAE